MGFAYYRHDLLASDFTAERILDKYFHSGRSTVFDGAPVDTEADLKRMVARSLGGAVNEPLHPMQLVVCGSAHLGFSPVPGLKLGTPFNPTISDIDIAVVSDVLFDRWWAELQGCRFSADIQRKIADNLYLGLIDPSIIPNVSKTRRLWWDLFGGMTAGVSNGPLLARGIRGRLYRTHWSMQTYHTLAIYGAREFLQGLIIDPHSR
jgi:hypothetical protein